MTAAGDGASPTAAVVRELLALGVLTVDDAVERGFALTETSVSHRSFRVRVGDGAGLFVKRADPLRSQGRDLATEAAVYRIARSSEPLAARHSRLPRASSADDSLIVLEAAPGTPLSETALAAGGLEPGTRSAMCALRPRRRARAPGATAAARAAAVAARRARAGLGRLRLAAGPVPRAAPAARGHARDPRRVPAARPRRGGPACLVHGDLRWANVLVALDAEPPRVWLVDWELACRGDPAWDVGSVLADLLAAAASRSLEAGELARRLGARARLPRRLPTTAALPGRASGRSSSGAASRWPESGSCRRSSSTAIRARASSRRSSPSCCRGPSRCSTAPEAIVSELARARGCSCGQ